MNFLPLIGQFSLASVSVDCQRSNGAVTSGGAPIEGLVPRGIMDKARRQPTEPRRVVQCRLRLGVFVATSDGAQICDRVSEQVGGENFVLVARSPFLLSLGRSASDDRVRSSSYQPIEGG